MNDFELKQVEDKKGGLEAKLMIGGSLLIILLALVSGISIITGLLRGY